MINFRYLTLLFALLHFTANAALLVDPYIGLNVSGSTKFGTVENDYDSSPVSIGSRVGFSQLGFSVGLDYQITSGIKIENNSNKFDATELAVFAGFDFPILLRAYAGYIFSADFEASGSNYDEGSGYKMGVGFTGLPFISINVEYKAVSYDKLNNATTQTADHNAVLLAVSLPLKLF